MVVTYVNFIHFQKGGQEESIFSPNITMTGQGCAPHTFHLFVFPPKEYNLQRHPGQDGDISDVSVGLVFNLAKGHMGDKLSQKSTFCAEIREIENA